MPGEVQKISSHVLQANWVQIFAFARCVKGPLGYEATLAKADMGQNGYV